MLWGLSELICIADASRFAFSSLMCGRCRCKCDNANLGAWAIADVSSHKLFIGWLIYVIAVKREAIIKIADRLNER